MTKIPVSMLSYEGTRRRWIEAVRKGDRAEADECRARLKILAEGFNPELEGRPLRMLNGNPDTRRRGRVNGS